jgi:hypothetical protein
LTGTRWRLPTLGVVAIILLGLLLVTVWTRGVTPVHLTETRIVAVVTDGKVQAEHVFPASHRGPLAIPGVEARCELTGRPDLIVVRCASQGTIATAMFHCEPYEIGFYSRRSALGFQSAGGTQLVEIAVDCRYDR